MRCAEGWEATGLSEIGGVSDGPGGHDRKGQTKASRFRNLGEIQFFIHDNFSWVRLPTIRMSSWSLEDTSGSQVSSGHPLLE